MEKWARWEPIKNISGKYYMDSFAWKEEGFVVELINEKKEKKYRSFLTIILMRFDIRMKVFI